MPFYVDTAITCHLDEDCGLMTRDDTSTDVPTSEFLTNFQYHQKNFYRNGKALIRSLNQASSLSSVSSITFPLLWLIENNNGDRTCYDLIFYLKEKLFPDNGKSLLPLNDIKQFSITVLLSRFQVYFPHEKELMKMFFKEISDVLSYADNADISGKRVAFSFDITVECFCYQKWNS
jgi:hypothetical protein